MELLGLAPGLLLHQVEAVPILAVPLLNFNIKSMAQRSVG
jgi:hypothetical protein